MPISVISTVGQSIFSNLGEDIREAARSFAKENTKLESIRSDPTAFPGEDLYDITLKTLTARAESVEFLRKSCAELNSLVRILDGTKPDRNDVLHLIATETPDGALAARIIADFAMDYFERDTEIHIVNGLQVMDGNRFQRTGLRTLIKLLYSLLAKSHPSVFTRIINPTGGFKGVVPYLTIIGMLEPEVQISYIYERSPELITLLGLPLTLDYQQLEPHVQLLEQLDSEGMMTETALKEALQLHDKEIVAHPIWSFVESDEIDGQRYYIINGLGEIALGHLRKVVKTPVYLSRQASERYAKTSNNSDEKRNYEKILNNIHDPLMRDSNIHTYPNGAKALVYKLGRQSERAFYLDQGEHILVLEFSRHKNETEYDVVPKSRKDYAKFELWEGDLTLS